MRALLEGFVRAVFERHSEDYHPDDGELQETSRDVQVRL
jgi:hypothetical protein